MAKLSKKCISCMEEDYDAWEKILKEVPGVVDMISYINAETRKEDIKGKLLWICQGFKLGLTKEQVAVYAKPIFNIPQMQQIYYGYQHHLSDEQIEYMAKPEYD